MVRYVFRKGRFGDKWRSRPVDSDSVFVQCWWIKFGLSLCRAVQHRCPAALVLDWHEHGCRCPIKLRVKNQKLYRSVNQITLPQRSLR
jgi:hypothetical protein